MKKTAIILGATGLTGNILLHKLLNLEAYDTIKVISRSPLNIEHPKLKILVGDLLELDQFKDNIVADEVYCCVGTTAKKTPNKELYKKIDFGIPVNAAALTKENNIDTFCVISALGADAKSAIFYNKTKGEMEEAVLAKEIKNTYIMQPSLILGDRNESRVGEKIGELFMTTFRFLLIGPLKKYRAIKAETIAKAMLYLTNRKPDIREVTSDKIEYYGTK